MTLLYKLTHYIPVFYSILFFLSSCSSTEKKEKDHLVFRYNEHANISSLDPAFAKDQRNIWAVHQIFSTLVALDSTLGIQPDIAKKWEISTDAKTYRFILKKNIYFHKSPYFNTPNHTREVKASDFVYSFSRLQDPKIASPGKWILNNVKHYKAINDTILEIELHQGSTSFLGLLTNKYCAVVPKEITENPKADFRKKPIGTGPFYVKLWQEDIKLVLRKNHHFYQKDSTGKSLPYLEAVAITFLPDKQSEFLAFLQGKLDFINGLDRSYKDALITDKGHIQARYQDNIRLQKSPYLNTEYLGFYLKDSILQDSRIRKAINYGFDREKMIMHLRNGVGSAAVSGFIPKGLGGFANIKGYDYQPIEAKKQIKSYLKDHKKLPKITITTAANYVDICQYIQHELEKIGLKIAIEVLPASSIRQARSSGKLQAFRASWIADYPDAENYLSLFYSKNIPPNGPNYTHFKDSLYDVLLEKAKSTTNVLDREKIYQKLDRIIIEKAPIVPLFYDQAVRFTHKNVRGLYSNPINLLDLKTVYKTKNTP